MAADEAKQFCQNNNLLYPSDQLDNFSEVFDRIQTVIGGKLKLRNENLISQTSENEFFHGEINGEALTNSRCLTGWDFYEIYGNEVCVK